MGTTAQKLQYLAATKQAIKQALTDNGISVPAGTTFREYASKITDIRSKFSFEPLPYTQVSLGSSTVNVSPYINIYADDGNSYTPQEWYELPGKGSSIHPVAFDIEAVGVHFLLYFKSFVNTDSYSYKDVTGQFSQTNGQLQHSPYNYTLITDNGTWTDSVDGGTKTAKAVVSNGVIVLSTTNSPLTWQIATGCGPGDAFQDKTDNSLARTNALYNQVEWLRHRFAINSGLTTEEEDGTIGTVTIVKDNGDMYFAVNGVKSNKLAKYNLVGTTAMSSANLTSAIADYIYAQQLVNNVNMNDDTIEGVSPSAKILTPGAKGAEAYAFNGYWMIATPILSNCSASPTNMEKNIQDAPAIYYIKRVLANQYENVSLSSVNMVQGYYLNRITILNSLVNFLNSSNGGSCDVPSTLSASVWCAARGSATAAWFVSAGVGFVGTNNVFNRCAVFGASTLS